jgi:outer membrane receptor protein involved in Fe transport
MQQFELETGIRYNYLSIRLKDESLGDVNIKPSALVANLGVNYTIGNKHYLYSSVSSGYRAPNIDDLGTLGIVDFRYELPTSNLKPEKSIQTELGYKFISKKWNLNISAFYISLKDIITRVKSAGEPINGYAVYNKQNIESAYIKGAEFSFSYSFNTNIQFHSNATYTYGQNLTKQEPMRRIPPLFGQSNIVWSKGSYEIMLSHQFAGKQDRLSQGDKDDNRIGKSGTPEWNLFNIMTSCHYKKIKLNIGMLNVLNEKYKTHGSGIYGMGQSFYLSTKISL